MTHSFKGTDFCELQRAMGHKPADDTEDELELLQWHLSNVVNRMILMGEECDNEVEMCRGYIRAHIDHLREHRCTGSSDDAIAVYESLLRVREPLFFMKLTSLMIGMMWC